MQDCYRLREIVGDEERLARFDRYMEPAGLIVGGRIVPNWLPDGASFWYADVTSASGALLKVDGETGMTTSLSQHDGAALNGPADREVPRSYYRQLWLTEPRVVAEAPSPDKRLFASLKNGNIMLRAVIDDRTMPLTTDGTLNLAWDIEAPRSRLNARGQIVQRTLDPWSPDGQRLFAMKMDRRAVPELPLVRYLKREQELCAVKYQRAGGAMDIAHPHVIDVLSKRTRPFDLGVTEDQYFTLIGWLPAGSQVLFTRHSRDFKTVDVLAGDPADGSVRTILSESASTFVALQHDVIFGADNHATILPSGSGLIWRSARTGWNHFYLYSIDGQLQRALTQGEFAVMDVVTVDEESGWLYFMAHHDQSRPYDVHLCRVRLAGGAIERLTPLDGFNEVSISPTKKRFTVVNSRPDRPFRTDFFSSEGEHLALLQQADVSALKEIGHGTSEEFTVLAADGKTELWGVLHKPADFDPKRKYPIVDHLYAGPQITQAAHHFGLDESWSMQLLDRALAQLGYIVISIDARGTPERSKAFQDVVYRNLGCHEIADHAAAIRQLGKRHAFVDLNRVGVWGHSWGGYFAIRALSEEPELFQVGVASAPATDPYDAIYYEPYLDLPARAKAVYDRAMLYPGASRIKGKLLMVSGTSDPMLPNTLKMTHHLIQAGVDHELVLLPEAGHGYQGKDEAYFIRKLVKHFEAHLKPRKAG